MQGPPPEVLVLAVVIAITLVVGIWFFLLRGSGTSEASEQAMTEVERFGELETFDTTIATQRMVMLRQITVYNRLASEESGDDARLATDASAAAQKVLESLDAYAAAVLNRRLTDAAFELVQMRDGLAALDAVVTEWKNLQ